MERHEASEAFEGLIGLAGAPSSTNESGSSPKGEAAHENDLTKAGLLDHVLFDHGSNRTAMVDEIGLEWNQIKVYLVKLYRTLSKLRLAPPIEATHQPSNTERERSASSRHDAHEVHPSLVFLFY